MLAHQSALSLKAMSTEASANKGNSDLWWRRLPVLSSIPAEFVERKNPFATLPNDLTLKVLAVLNAEDLRIITSVSKSLGELAKVEALWKNLYHERFSHHNHKIADSSNLPWKDMYRECLHAEILSQETWAFWKAKKAEEQLAMRSPIQRLIPVSTVPVEEAFKCSYKPLESSFIVLGASGSGKTCLVNRLRGFPFNSHEEPTMGAREVKYWRFHDGLLIKFHIWDCAGSERYTRLSAKLLKFARFIVLVYNGSQPDSLENLKTWRNEISKECGSKPTFVVCTQSDQIKPSNTPESKLDSDISQMGSNDPLNLVKTWTENELAIFLGAVSSSSGSGVDEFANLLCSFVSERGLYD